MGLDIENAITAIAAVAITGLGCRLWYARRIAALQREMAKRDAAHDSAVRLGAQARKQVEELQRILSEYRRRLSAAQMARGARTEAAASTPAASAAALAAAAALEAGDANAQKRLAPPGGWADTQPL